VGAVEGVGDPAMEMVVAARRNLARGHSQEAR